MTKIIFVRHGQTDQNLDEIAGLEAKEGDYPLNKQGVEQVRKTRDRLAGEHIDIIASSPLARAKETAEIINELHRFPIIYKADLRERIGGHVGEEKWNELFDATKNIQLNNADFEDVRSFFQRVYAVIRSISTEYPDKTVLVVAHGGVHHAFYAYFNELPLEGNMRIDRMHNSDVRYYVVNAKGEG